MCRKWNKLERSVGMAWTGAWCLWLSFQVIAQSGLWH